LLVLLPLMVDSVAADTITYGCWLLMVLSLTDAVDAGAAVAGAVVAGAVVAGTVATDAVA
jgi:hypothetical protein